MGSMIAPPYLGLLSGISTPPAGSASAPGFAIESGPNFNLKPETGFGYDLGGDLQLPKEQIAITGDIYLTNLYNRFFSQLVNTGQTCAQLGTCVPGTPGTDVVLNSTSANISNARFEGVELGISRQPAVGFGFNVSGALNRGYYYDLPPNFYCSFVPTAAQPCTPANYDQNLNVISGQNTNGTAVGIGGLSYNGNMRIPYAQGNAEINYTFPNQMFVSIGETYYGKNNSLDEPPFGIGYATVRVPISRSLAIQVSGDNIFNAYPGYMAVYGTGVPIDLANGGTAATNGNQLGPATWRFMIMTRP
jgi:outer membrane receptor protein involved in Fe transport